MNCGPAISFSYDAIRRRTAVTAANGGVTTFVYDNRSNLVETINPLSIPTTQAYDTYGQRMITRIDGNGAPTTYSYDPLQRVVGKAYANGSLVTYAFDQAGQQTSVQDSTGITSYTYYPTSFKKSVAYPTGKILTYAYSAANQRTGLIDPNGGLTTWSYATNEGVTGIQTPASGSSEVYRLHYDNYVSGWTYGNGANMSRTNLVGPSQLCEASRSYTNPSGATIASYTTTYDGAYNKTSIAELDNVTTFAYDPKNQVANEFRSGSYPYNTTYVYDALGNRLQKVDSGAITTNTYNPANQLLVSVPPTGAPTTSTYDRNGNLTLQNTGGALTTFLWDQENRLTSLASPSTGITTYLYSHEGHWQATINSSGTTNFVWDNDIVLQETNASGIVQAQYTQGPGTWDLLLSQNRSGTTQYLAPDDRENIRLVLSGAGAVLDNNQYKAFLEQLNTPTQVNPYLGWGNANGRQELPGYVRTGARILLPVWGRWLNPDMLGFEGGDWNWFRVVGNNPVRWVDPTGLAVPFTSASSSPGSQSGYSSASESADGTSFCCFGWISFCCPPKPKPKPGPPAPSPPKPPAPTRCPMPIGPKGCTKNYPVGSDCWSMCLQLGKVLRDPGGEQPIGIDVIVDCCQELFPSLGGGDACDIAANDWCTLLGPTICDGGGTTVSL